MSATGAQSSSCFVSPPGPLTDPVIFQAKKDSNWMFSRYIEQILKKTLVRVFLNSFG